LEHVVKVLCFCHPDDEPEMWAQQEDTLRRLFASARRNRLEFLLEVIPSKVAPVDDDTTAKIIDRIYALGIYPDWWKLEPFKTDAAWARACDAITRHDPHVRGIVVLGLDAPAEDLAQSFQLAARQPLVKGFAVGRTIFADAARAWLTGRMTDVDAVEQMAARFRALAETWDQARASTQAQEGQAA
jgi:5-dehydro-2-deoxygluconokinase